MDGKGEETRIYKSTQIIYGMCGQGGHQTAQQQWWAELSTELLGDTGGYQGEPITVRTVHCLGLMSALLPRA